MSVAWRIIQGDVRASLASLPAGSCRVCVTSPPYFGLRDYGHAGQIGLEASPADYIAALVEVFREVRRVLADDGTLWLNLGDTYAGSWGAQGRPQGDGQMAGRSVASARQIASHPRFKGKTGTRGQEEDLKPKDLMMIPARVALALQADGWYLRSDIIWHKPNPMPESVTDRPTKAHEYLFLFAKSERYYYDAKAIAEPLAWPDDRRPPVGTLDGVERPSSGGRKEGKNSRIHVTRTPNGAPPQNRMPPIGGIKKAGGDNATYSGNTPEWPTTRNKRDVWTVATQPYSGAHFATYPEALVEPCILAGSAVGDTVPDPFSGSGTTGAVAVRHGRGYIGCELNPDYIALSERRIGAEAPLFVKGGAV